MLSPPSPDRALPTTAISQRPSHCHHQYHLHYLLHNFFPFCMCLSVANFIISVLVSLCSLAFLLSHLSVMFSPWCLFDKGFVPISDMHCYRIWIVNDNYLFWWWMNECPIPSSDSSFGSECCQINLSPHLLLTVTCLGYHFAVFSHERCWYYKS